MNRRQAQFHLCCAAALAVFLPGCCLWKPSPNERAVAARQVLEASSEAELRGDVDQARELLSDAISRDPEAAEHHYRLAKLLVRENDHSEAFRHFHQCTQLNPDDPRSFRELSQLMIRHGNLDRAQEFIDKALANNPQDAEALALRAKIQHRSGKLEEALNDVLQALSVTPSSPDLTLAAASYYQELGRADKASELLRRAEWKVGLTPEKRSEILWKLGESYIAQNRWDDSASAFERAIEHKASPTEDDRYMLAYAQIQAGRKDAAVESLNRVLAKNPAHQETLALLGDLSGIRQASQKSAPATVEEPKVFRLATQRRQD